MAKLNHTQVAEGGGSPTIHRQSPTTTKNTGTFPCKPRTRITKTQFCSGTIAKRGSRNCKRYKFSRHVPQIVSQAKTRRVPKTHHRSVTTEQTHKKRDVQNGNTCIDTPCITAGRDHTPTRFKRRLFPRSYEETLSEIHAVHGKWGCISIQGPTIWPQYSTQGVHQNSQACPQPAQGSHDPCPRLPGRLDYEALRPQARPQNSLRSSAVTENVRVAHKFPQVYTSPPQPFRIYRPGMGPPWGNPETQTGENPETQARCQDSATGYTNQGKETGQSHRSNQVDGAIRASGSNALEETTVEGERDLVTENSRLGSTYNSNKVDAGPAQMVDTPYKHTGGSPPENTNPRPRAVHRCILSWLWRNNGQPNHVRGMEQEVSGETHQRPRTGGSKESSDNVCTECGELYGKSPFGQPDYCLVPKKAREPEVTSPQQTLGKSDDLDTGAQGHPDPSIYTGLQERRGRCPEQKGPDSCIRMVTQHNRVQQGSTMVQTPTPVDGPHGNGQKQTDRGFCMSVSPRERSSSRCSEHHLELPRHPVAVPPHGSDNQGHQQDQGGAVNHPNLDSPRPTNKALVPRPIESYFLKVTDSGKEDRHHNPARPPQDRTGTDGGPRDPQTEGMDSAQVRTQHGPTHAMSDSEDEAGTHEDSPPGAHFISPGTLNKVTPVTPRKSRESLINEALESQGFHDSVIPFVNRPQRDSSCQVYDTHWAKFQGYCDRRGWDPRLTNAQRMCEYLVHLFETDKAVNTIENTHSALRSVLRHYGYPEKMPGLVHDCINSFWKARPRERKVCTEWDVNFVLESFLKPPYVDDDGEDNGICLRLMTIKTAFLTAMACSRRKSEIHAFSRAKGFFRKETKPSGEVILTIHVTPGFVAKNQKARNLYPQVDLRSIFHEHLDDPKEALLCPVRAIIRYLERTKDFPNAKGLMFVNPDRTKSTTASSLSCWLKAAITTAYKGSDSSPHCTPHEIRAVSTSLSAFNHASVADIVEAGTWKNYSTFVENYLRDVAPSSCDGTVKYNLPSFVAAGNRITNS